MPGGDQATIFISGAGRGIGRACAMRFAAAGYFVGLYDIAEATLAETTAELRARYGEGSCCAQRVDVRDAASVRAAVDHFAEQGGGRLDILVNNAAIMEVGAFERVDLEAHQRTIAVNLGGVIALSHACFSLLRETPRARVINLSSVAALRGIPEMASYSATKHGVRALTEALELEWASHDIRVCDVMPSFVDTDLLRDTQTLTAEQFAGVGLGPEDVAARVWQAAHSRRWRTHWPIGWQSALAYRFGALLPEVVQRALLRFLTKL